MRRQARGERCGERGGGGDCSTRRQRRDRDGRQSDLDGGVDRFGGDNFPVPLLVERRHRLIEREENGEQCLGRKTGEVGVEAVEVKGV